LKTLESSEENVEARGLKSFQKLPHLVIGLSVLLSSASIRELKRIVRGEIKYSRSDKVQKLGDSLKTPPRAKNRSSRFRGENRPEKKYKANQNRTVRSKKDFGG